MKYNPIVTLTWTEVIMAAAVGVYRQIQRKAEHRPNVHGEDERDTWSNQIEGACGELAFARCVNRYWHAPVGNYNKGGDGVSGIEVRTRSEHHFEINLYEEDRPEKVYVLVTGAAPHYVVRGWAYGHEFALMDLPNGRPPMRYIPKSKMQPLDTVPL